MTSDHEKHATELAARFYTEVIFRDKTTTGGYVYMAVNPELEGCMAQGETLRKARENLNLVRIEYIEHLLEHDLPIPDPVWLATVTEGDSFVVPMRTEPSFEVALELVAQPSNREPDYKVDVKIQNDNLVYS